MLQSVKVRPKPRHQSEQEKGILLGFVCVCVRACACQARAFVFILYVLWPDELFLPLIPCPVACRVLVLGVICFVCVCVCVCWKDCECPIQHLLVSEPDVFALIVYLGEGRHETCTSTNNEAPRVDRLHHAASCTNEIFANGRSVA